MAEPVMEVLIPTISGREHHLRKAVETYLAVASMPTEVHVVLNLPCVGTGWNEAAKLLKGGEFVHFSNDDIVPHVGWDQAAMETIARGAIPAPVIEYPDGRFMVYHGVTPETQNRVEVPTSVLHTLSCEQWELLKPFPDIHYYSDDYMSWAGRQQGIITEFNPAYRFTHMWAMEGRGAGMSEADRMKHDRAIYNKLTGENRT